MDTTSSYLSMPTIDRPFGISLWPYFNKAFEIFAGYPADEFQFIAGQTPMSTLKETVTFILTYYVVILYGRRFMRDREPFKLKTLFLIHNFCLTASSAILLALFIEKLSPILVHNGLFYAICKHDGG